MSYIPPDCVICLEVLANELAAAPCGHLFHANCLRTAVAKSTSKCPLCRKAFVPARILPVSFALTKASATIPGLSEEEAVQVLHLQQAAQAACAAKAAIANELSSVKSSLVNAETALQEAKTEHAALTAVLASAKKELARAEKAVLGKDYELTKYKGLYGHAYDRACVLEEKARRLEGVERMMAELESKESVVAWASNAKAKLTVAEQAEQLYSALMASAHSLQTRDKEVAELKNALTHQKKSISEYKLALERTRKLIERRNADTLKVSSRQRKTPEKSVQFESSFQCIKRFKAQPSLLRNK